MKFSNFLLYTALVFMTTGEANANITYYLDKTIGPDRVSGDIVTNGTLGNNIVSDIIGWDLTFYANVTGPFGSVYGPFELTSSSGNSTLQNQMLGIGGYFSATATDLYFNFSSGAGTYFQGSNRFGVQYSLCFQAQANMCEGGAPAGEAIQVFGLSTSGNTEFAPLSGTQVIATAAGSVPEPSTWAMMLLGFAGLGYAAYRRAHLKSATALFTEVETGRLSLITLKKTGVAR